MSEILRCQASQHRESISLTPRENPWEFFKKEKAAGRGKAMARGRLPKGALSQNPAAKSVFSCRYGHQKKYWQAKFCQASRYQAQAPLNPMTAKRMIAASEIKTKRQSSLPPSNSTFFLLIANFCQFLSWYTHSHFP